MPITRENWEYFFQGTFAEHHVSSLFYFYGYEVQKASPDVGIDLLVTNIARTRFRGEPALNIQIQVKSGLLDQSGAFVVLPADELDFLCNGEDRYCVFVLLSNLRAKMDPGSYERGDDPDASLAIERAFMRDMEQRTATIGRDLKRQNLMSMFDFSTAEVTLVWLHSSQMSRLRDQNSWTGMSDNRLGLNINVNETTVSIAGDYLISELSDLAYIVRYCKAGSRIREGQMFLSDY